MKARYWQITYTWWTNAPTAKQQRWIKKPQKTKHPCRYLLHPHSLPKGKYWKHRVPVSSTTRSATAEPRWPTDSSTCTSFERSLGHVKLFLWALQNTGGLLTPERFPEAFHICFELFGGRTLRAVGCFVPQTTAASLWEGEETPEAPTSTAG